VKQLVSRPRKGIKYYLELEARLNSVIEKINYGVSLVIVEGSHDEAALRKVGLRTPVIGFSKSGLPVFAFVDELMKCYKGLTVVVLLDFDEEGAKMAERISRELEEGGVKVERFFRRKLGELLVREGIRRIEEVPLIKLKASY
jgi:5S rRNA maturation endonuclease (ribonuclease M5)